MYYNTNKSIVLVVAFEDKNAGVYKLPPPLLIEKSYTLI